MARSLIDPRNEVRALRRAAVLLERVRQDEAARDPELDRLQAGIGTIQRAAADGRAIDPSAIDRMMTLLARVAPDDHDLVRRNALGETRELLERLARPEPAERDH